MNNNNALVPLEPRDLTEAKGVATVFAQSGMFKDATGMAQALVKIMAGREIGLGAFASMQAVYIVDGRPTYSANAIARKIKVHPHYDYRVIELTDTVCELRFFEDGELLGVERLTIEEAHAHGYDTSKGTPKDTWKKHPRNMLFARCITNGTRFHCPDVFDVPVYTPDEMDEQEPGFDNIEGEFVVSAPIPTPEPEQEPEDSRDPDNLDDYIQPRPQEQPSPAPQQAAPAPAPKTNGGTHTLTIKPPVLMKLARDLRPDLKNAVDAHVAASVRKALGGIANWSDFTGTQEEAEALIRARAIEKAREILTPPEEPEEPVFEEGDWLRGSQAGQLPGMDKIPARSTTYRD